jgi:phosphoribosyl 1,2-cyclic phosphodiesterase
MRICSIASGSSGNCIYIGSDNTHILIDCGISGKRIVKGLNDLGLDASDISAVLITHEHTDHIKGLGVISRKYGLPMYTSQKTFKASLKAPGIGEIDPGLLKPIEA